MRYRNRISAGQSPALPRVLRCFWNACDSVLPSTPSAGAAQSRGGRATGWGKSVSFRNATDWNWYGVNWMENVGSARERGAEARGLRTCWGDQPYLSTRSRSESHGAGEIWSGTDHQSSGRAPWRRCRRDWNSLLEWLKQVKENLTPPRGCWQNWATGTCCFCERRAVGDGGTQGCPWSRCLKRSKAEAPKERAGYLLKGTGLQGALDAPWGAMGWVRLEGERLSAGPAKGLGGRARELRVWSSCLQVWGLQAWEGEPAPWNWALGKKYILGEKLTLRNKNKENILLKQWNL